MAFYIWAKTLALGTRCKMLQVCKDKDKSSVGSRTPSSLALKQEKCPLCRRLGHCSLISRDRSWWLSLLQEFGHCWERFIGFYNFFWSQFYTNNVMKARCPWQVHIQWLDPLCLAACCFSQAHCSVWNTYPPLAPRPSGTPIPSLGSVLMSLPQGNCLLRLHMPRWDCVPSFMSFVMVRNSFLPSQICMLPISPPGNKLY